MLAGLIFIHHRLFNAKTVISSETLQLGLPLFFVFGSSSSQNKDCSGIYIFPP